jgi:hypothetical protein
MSTWRLKRTRQCKKCPWRVDVDPHDIPNGYCENKHRQLASTIADGNDLIGQLRRPEIKVMACHETKDAHCVGWMMNQLGPGNNIVLRLKMRSCENAGQIKLIGEQHASFEDTLPNSTA